MIRPVVAELRRRFAVAAAETGYLERYRRAEVGVAVVAADRAHCLQVLEACERLVLDRPELQVLSAQVRLSTPDDTG